MLRGDKLVHLESPKAQSTYMSRVFISGSSTGLGLMAADLLISQGHNVVLHARNAKRADEARQRLHQAEAIVVGDIETIANARELAAQVNALGHFDAVIHDAAAGYREGHRVTADGSPHVFAINTLSAYILTALIGRPKRLDRLCREQAPRRDARLRSRDAGRMCSPIRWSRDGCRPRWVPLALPMTWIRRIEPRCGSRPATIRKPIYYPKRMEPNPEARDVAPQDRLIAICADISGVALPT
jgi:hypothetical protein